MYTRFTICHPYAGTTITLLLSLRSLQPYPVFICSSTPPLLSFCWMPVHTIYDCHPFAGTTITLLLSLRSLQPYPVFICSSTPPLLGMQVRFGLKRRRWRLANRVIMKHWILDIFRPGHCNISILVIIMKTHQAPHLGMSAKQLKMYNNNY